METKIRVKKGLHSFLEEIGRFSVTSGFHYDVHLDVNKVEILHHNAKWKIIVEPRRILVTTTNDKLIVTRNALILNGKEIHELCTNLRCYTAEEIIEKIIFAITLHYSYNDDLKWLYRWISG